MTVLHRKKLLLRNYVTLRLTNYRYSYTVGYLLDSPQSVYVLVHPTVKGKLVLLTDSKPDLNGDPEQQQPV